MGSSLEVLDHVRLNFSSSGLLFLNISLAFIMFGVALDIKIENFTKLIRKPASVLTGIISQFILLPALTFALVILLKPTPTVALGMILVASCPGGNISNFMSSMAGGNTALSVGLTAFATLSAIFMTPINFSFWGGLYIDFYNAKDAAALVRPLEIDKYQMFLTVFILLGIPVILGLYFARKFPALTSKILRPIKTGSIVFFVIMVIGMISANFNHFIKFVHLVFLIVLIHNALALSTGFIFSTITKRPRLDRRAITIETGIQNSGLALALIFNPKIFPPELELGGMAVIAAWWGIWHILSGLTIAALWKKKSIVPLAENKV
jgi:BASS family bile acid:Na+ symporter